LAPKIVTALLKYWPVTCSKKELMFLNEMEEILDRVQPHHLGQTQVPLFRQVAKSINSPHFQVSERAIYVLNNDVILRFITNNRETLVPILSRALYANTHLHRKPGERDVKITKKSRTTRANWEGRRRNDQGHSPFSNRGDRRYEEFACAWFGDAQISRQDR
jgi:hypothetical protein